MEIVPGVPRQIRGSKYDELFEQALFTLTGTKNATVIDPPPAGLRYALKRRPDLKEKGLKLSFRSGKAYLSVENPK